MLRWGLFVALAFMMVSPSTLRPHENECPVYLEIEGNVPRYAAPRESEHAFTTCTPSWLTSFNSGCTSVEIRFPEGGSLTAHGCDDFDSALQFAYGESIKETNELPGDGASCNLSHSWLPEMPECNQEIRRNGFTVRTTCAKPSEVKLGGQTDVEKAERKARAVMPGQLGGDDSRNRLSPDSDNNLVIPSKGSSLDVEVCCNGKTADLWTTRRCCNTGCCSKYSPIFFAVVVGGACLIVLILTLIWYCCIYKNRQPQQTRIEAVTILAPPPYGYPQQGYYQMQQPTAPMMQAYATQPPQAFPAVQTTAA